MKVLPIMTNKANYRKHNDGSHSSSTYHKKDGTPIRAILKEEARKEIFEYLIESLKSGDMYESTNLYRKINEMTQEESITNK